MKNGAKNIQAQAYNGACMVHIRKALDVKLMEISLQKKSYTKSFHLQSRNGFVWYRCSGDLTVRNI